MKLSCRTCKKPLPEPLGTLGPFCSERCRIMDLGAWADGSYQVPGENVSEAEENQASGQEADGPSGPKTIH